MILEWTFSHFFNFLDGFFMDFHFFDVLKRGDAACYFRSSIYLRNMLPSASSIAVRDLVFFSAKKN